MESFCPSCGKKVLVDGGGLYTCPYCNNNFRIEDSDSREVQNNDKEKILCPKCGSGNVLITNEMKIKTEHRGLIGWMLWILLAFLSFGLILIIPLITNSKVKSKNKKVLICQNCGNKWSISNMKKFLNTEITLK